MNVFTENAIIGFIGYKITKQKNDYLKDFHSQKQIGRVTCFPIIHQEAFQLLPASQRIEKYGKIARKASYYPLLPFLSTSRTG